MSRKSCCDNRDRKGDWYDCEQDPVPPGMVFLHTQIEAKNCEKSESKFHPVKHRLDHEFTQSRNTKPLELI